MSCQSLFSGKNKKNKSSCRLLIFPRVLSVKRLKGKHRFQTQMALIYRNTDSVISFTPFVRHFNPRHISQSLYNKRPVSIEISLRTFAVDKQVLLQVDKNKGL